MAQVCALFTCVSLTELPRLSVARLLFCRYVCKTG
jgi:hypothetical protein